MAKKAKDVKTNVMRILDKAKIDYTPITYECDEFISGLHTAELTGTPVEATFKTLILQGKSQDYYVFVLPIADELDLKKCAAAVQEKALTMLPQKDLTKVSGYVRGGCSPIGMKKPYVTVLHERARQLDSIYISGGRVGSTVQLHPLDLANLIHAKFADIIQAETS